MATNIAGPWPPPPAMDISIGGTLYYELTGLWLLICAFLVFFMQASSPPSQAALVPAAARSPPPTPPTPPPPTHPRSPSRRPASLSLKLAPSA